MPSSLQGYLNAQDAVDQICLSLNSPNGNNLVFILVEGSYDTRLYSKFFNDHASVEYVGGGKEHVIKALEHFKTITKKVFGICDADFRHIEKDYPNISNLFFTDCHDIEMTMLHTAGVLKNVLVAYDEAGNSAVIMLKALELAEFPAYTRWYNERNMSELKFEYVKLGKIVTPHNINATFNKGKYISKLNDCSMDKTITEEKIAAFIQNNPISDYFNLCNGHDVTAIIALFLGGKVSKENFCLNLQISFRIDDFKTTKLYSDILAWQKSNHYQILLD